MGVFNILLIIISCCFFSVMKLPNVLGYGGAVVFLLAVVMGWYGMPKLINSQISGVSLSPQSTTETFNDGVVSYRRKNFTRLDFSKNRGIPKAATFTYPPYLILQAEGLDVRKCCQISKHTVPFRYAWSCTDWKSVVNNRKIIKTPRMYVKFKRAPEASIFSTTDIRRIHTLKTKNSAASAIHYKRNVAENIYY